MIVFDLEDFLFIVIIDYVNEKVEVGIWDEEEVLVKF